MEHELKHGFQRNHAGEGAQRVVFAQRVAREVGGPDVRAGFTQTSGLGERHGGERHLRELGQVEQAFRMTVGHAVGGQFLRIITHDGEDGEAELLAGHLVGALPHLACGRGLGTLVEHHALLLDALARVDEGGLRRTHDGGATGHDIAVDAAGHFQHHAGVGHTADAFDGDLPPRRRAAPCRTCCTSSLRSGAARPSRRAPAPRWAVADSHMPCTSGAARPETAAPRWEV